MADEIKFILPEDISKKERKELEKRISKIFDPSAIVTKIENNRSVTLQELHPWGNQLNSFFRFLQIIPLIQGINPSGKIFTEATNEEGWKIIQTMLLKEEERARNEQKDIEKEVAIQ